MIEARPSAPDSAGVEYCKSKPVANAIAWARGREALKDTNRQAHLPLPNPESFQGRISLGAVHEIFTDHACVFSDWQSGATLQGDTGLFVIVVDVDDFGYKKI